MKAFTFVRPETIEEAAKAWEKDAVIKAGGVDLLDRMKERIAEPARVIGLVDVAVDDPGRGIGVVGEGRESHLVIGALTTLAEIAASPVIRKWNAALAEAAGLAASPQIRARATLGGNLCQHTRCGYYRHRSFPCLKRGDDACPVLDDGAVQESAAILGNRPCASAHPSSLAPVLCASDAFATIARPDGKHDYVPLSALFAQPSRGVASDIAFPGNGVLQSVSLTSRPHSAFEEIRQKAAFDWALVSCALCIDVGPSVVDGATIWLGSVAPTPWHAEAAEKALIGKKLTDETIASAADAAVLGATPLPGNAYKVDLVKVVVRRALERLRAMK